MAGFFFSFNSEGHLPMLGFILYIAAIAITALVVAAKYFGVVIPNATELVMRDPAQSLLVAIAMSFVARWT